MIGLRPVNDTSLFPHLLPERSVAEQNAIANQ